MTAVLLYAGWTLLLVLMYAFPRVPQVLTGSKRADAWTRGLPSIDPGILVRANHAHANCVENFAIFAGVVVVAALMQKSAIVDALAAWVLYARVGQGVVHLIGISFVLVLIRATLFLVQVALILFIIWQLLH
ncbi:MAG: MAPEG family protein [Nevskia sp.]